MWNVVTFVKSRPKPELPESVAPTTYELALDDAEEGTVRPLHLAKSTRGVRPNSGACAGGLAGARNAVDGGGRSQGGCSTVGAAADGFCPSRFPACGADGSNASAAGDIHRPVPATGADDVARLKKAYLDQRKFPAIRGDGIFDVAVSTGNHVRSLFAFEPNFRYCKTEGPKFVAGEASKRPAPSRQTVGSSLLECESRRKVPND